jgi:hypothetical protein
MAGREGSESALAYPDVIGIRSPEELAAAASEAPEIVEAVSGARRYRVIARRDRDDIQVLDDERALGAGLAGV